MQVIDQMCEGGVEYCIGVTPRGSECPPFAGFISGSSAKYVSGSFFGSQMPVLLDSGPKESLCILHIYVENRGGD